MSGMDMAGICVKGRIILDWGKTVVRGKWV